MENKNNKKSEWMKFDDGKDKLIFRLEEDGGFEIKEYNGKKPPEERNTKEYEEWIFSTMGIIAKILADLENKSGL